MIKKRLFLIPLIILFFSACFSPWQGDEGTLTLQLGPGNSGRVAVEENERNSLSYTITLTGPGPSVTQTFSGTATATFSLQPGTWNVTVKGRGARPMHEAYQNVFPDVMLRAYGEKTVTVKGGGSASEAITMFPAIEAKDGEQLETAFSNANTYGKKEYVFITGDIKLADGNGSPGKGNPIIVNPGQDIELRAEKPVRIERDDAAVGYKGAVLFTIEDGGKLTLGKEGETHQYLHITGDIGGEDQYESPYAEAPLVSVTLGGTLVMHDAWINHNRVDISADPVPGVLVAGAGAKFDMYGGQIDGNSGNMNGGGVAVEGGGTFTLYGGDFKSNNASVGGQVYVGDGSWFYMKGGTLSNMGGTPGGKQAEKGAGVFVDIGGTFKKERGGTIYGTGTGKYNLNAEGSGDAVFYSAGSDSYKRDATLLPSDNISTEDTTETSNWVKL